MTPHSSTLEYSMASSSVCNFLKNLFPWIAVLFPFFIYTCISAHGIFSILITSLLVLLATIFFLNSSKQKQALVEEPLKKAHPELICSEQSHVEETEKVANSTKESQEDMILNCLANGSPDSYSESEVMDQYYSSTSEEDSDIDWPFPGNIVDPITDCSDGSISDEESLIEIALPSGHYLGSKEEEDELKEPKWGFQQKCRDFSPEAIFGQRSLRELIAEINETYDMNEEENLIEIDISMGSIKCSRFEIEA